MRLDWIGWIATALFASSYFFKQPMALRKVQALAALLWVVYGLLIHALPVVVANVVVAAVAVGSGLRGNFAGRALTPPETASSDAR
jgi:hypothetical protein